MRGSMRHSSKNDFRGRSVRRREEGRGASSRSTPKPSNESAGGNLTRPVRSPHDERAAFVEEVR